MSAVHGTVKVRGQHPKLHQIWQAMRILRRWTVDQLVIASVGVGTRYAREYVNRLTRCGYVVLARRGRLGQVGERNVMALVRNTGPLPPMMRRESVTVYDPNTGITWGDGGVVITPTREPGAPRPPRPATDTQRVALVCILEGRPASAALRDPGNCGAVSSMLNGLRMRGLIDQAGTLTAAGRALAEHDKTVCDAVCPPGWQP